MKQNKRETTTAKKNQNDPGEATIRVSFAEVKISKNGLKFVSQKTKDLPIPI